MVTYILIVVAIIVFILMLNRWLPRLYDHIQKVLKVLTPFAFVFSLIYFLTFEYPGIKRDISLKHEERRLTYLNYLADDWTPNRIREEAFFELIRNYDVRDFSGLKISNSKEGFLSPFFVPRCFKYDNPVRIKKDSIVTISKIDSLNYLRVVLDLTNVNLMNSDLSYCNFDQGYRRRPQAYSYWDASDRDVRKYVFRTKFGDLENTCFSHATIGSCDFSNAMLTNVNFYDAFVRQGDFRGCHLLYCDLRDADFCGADFFGAYLYKVRISERTKFSGIRNFDKIKVLSPYVFLHIKVWNVGLDEEVKKWNYDWQSLEDEELRDKWVLLNQIVFREKCENPILEYKNRIRKKYVKENGPDYDWEKEL